MKNKYLWQICLTAILYFTSYTIYGQINPYQRLTDPLAITYIDSLYPQKFSSGIGTGAIAEDKGSGVITHIWCTFDWHNPQFAGTITIQIDDKIIVSEPFHSFFLNEHGLLREPLKTTMSGGFICDVQMPYKKSFKITIQPTDSHCCVFWGIGWRPLPLNLVPESFALNLSGDFAEQQKAAEEVVNKKAPQVPTGLTLLNANVAVRPNSAEELYSIQDQGVIRRLNFKTDNYTQSLLDSLFLEINWDNSPYTSVSVPFSDFFVVTNAFAPVNSFYIKTDSANGLTSYFPMPFSSAAKIRVANKSSQVIYINSSLEYSREIIDRDKNGYFFANFKQIRSVENLHLNIARIRGQGKYVSTVMNVRDSLDHHAYMEGDAKFTIDSSSENYIQYTGTEDYFNGGWYFIEGAFSRPFAGSPEANATMYRIHCLDAMDFKRSLDLKWEHGSANNYPALYRIAYTYYKKWKPFWVSADTVRAGDFLKIGGSGYLPGEDISGYLDSEVVFKTKAGPDGGFEIYFPVPDVFKRGLKKLIINSDEYDEFITVIEKPEIFIIRDSLPDVFRYEDSVFIAAYGLLPKTEYTVMIADIEILKIKTSDSSGAFARYAKIPYVADGHYPVVLKKHGEIIAFTEDSLTLTRDLEYEFEALTIDRVTPGGYYSRTNLIYSKHDRWSQQSGFFYAAPGTGAVLSFTFYVPVASFYKPSMFLTMGSRFGQYNIYIDNKYLFYFDGYLNLEFGRPLRSPELIIGDTIFLLKGIHTVSFKNVGKSPFAVESAILADNMILKSVLPFSQPELPPRAEKGILYPNPYSRDKNLHSTLILPSADCPETENCSYTISCSNILGEQVFKTTAVAAFGRISFPVGNLPIGTYFCTFKNEQTGITQTYPIIVTD